MVKKLVTVVETAPYLAKCKLSAEQRNEIVDLLAETPDLGDPLVGTGGYRKFRYASKQGKGKSGGARIVHLYHNESMPVFIMAIFEKGEKSNLTKAERNKLKSIAKDIISNYGASS